MQCVGVTTAAHVGDGAVVSPPLVFMVTLASGTGRKLGLVGGARGGGDGVIFRRERLWPRSDTPANENAALVLISTASSSSL